MVHRFTLNSDMIAIDTESDAVMELDAVAYGLIGAWSEESGAFGRDETDAARRDHGSKAVDEAMEEIQELILDGQLFARPPDAVKMAVAAGKEAGGSGGTAPASIAGAADAPSLVPTIKSLCLHMAHDCNMRCAYCFASDGSFGGKRALMPAGVARAAIDFAIASSGARRNIEIDFFGGEPLLNLEAIKETVKYARSLEEQSGKRFRFTLTTNGSLLDDEAAAYVNENMDNLVLSADGRRDVHDAMRKSFSGGGTYDAVIPRLLAAVAGRGDKDYYVRGTYTARNRDFAADVFHLAELGFSHISVEPVVAPVDKALEFSPSDLPILLNEYERLANGIREAATRESPRIDFFHFRVDLDGGPCRERRLKGCGAGFEYAAVAPDGGIYPCHQFAGNDEFRMGDVFSGVTDQSIPARFREAGRVDKPSCRDCWAKYFCGGGCAANAWHYNRDISLPNPFYCALQKKRLECAVWLLLTLSRDRVYNNADE